MNTANPGNSKMNRSFATRAATRAGVLTLAALGLVLGGGGLWYWRQTKPRAVEVVASPAPNVVLSGITARILAGLDTPIELRLFAPAEVSALPATLADYVTRVESLLAEYERAAAGKLRVTKSDPKTDAAARAAAGAAGVTPFATGNGEVVYLGLTVGNGTRVETVAPLAPEWEAALESDVSRAIVRVTARLAPAMPPAAPTPSQPAPIDPALSEELLRMFPDLGTRSFEAMAQTLRESAAAEFKSAALDLQAKIHSAQQTLAASRQNESESEQQAALKELQRVQSEQAAKLQDITARLQERLAVLQRLQTASPAPAAAQSP